MWKAKRTTEQNKCKRQKVSDNMKIVRLGFRYENEESVDVEEE